MSNSRKNHSGETIIDDTKDYDPRLVAKAPEGLALPADAPVVVCSVCGQTPEFWGLRYSRGTWVCGCVQASPPFTDQVDGLFDVRPHARGLTEDQLIVAARLAKDAFAALTKLIAFKQGTLTEAEGRAIVTEHRDMLKAKHSVFDYRPMNNDRKESMESLVRACTTINEMHIKEMQESKPSTPWLSSLGPVPGSHNKRG
jgi:hypothetical protein